MALGLEKLFPFRSAAFITLHKCASHFFSRHLLPHLQGRQHIDYQLQHYENRLDGPPVIRKRGFIYGPVRILDREHPSYELTETMLSACVSGGLNGIFLVRDPRAILVSMYYSFGFSHPQSPHPDISEYQCLRRQRIQAVDVNTFALDSAEELRERFVRLETLSRQMKPRIVLRYEDMVEGFESFYSRLNAFAPIVPGFKKRMYILTRPQKEENILRHKRQARVGSFREKLSPETLARLQEIFAAVLRDLQY